MNPETETYRPFLNRRLSPAIRELLANRQQFLAEAAQLAMRRFSRPPLPREIVVSMSRPVSAFQAPFGRGAMPRNG